MLPVLFKLGPVPIYSFGVFLTLGVVLGMFVSWRKAREYHFEDDDFFDLVFSGLLGGILLGRAWYVVEHFSEFGWNILKWIWFTHYVGLSFLGGVVGALIGIYLISRRLDQDWFKILDLLSIGAALGLSLAWVGAFLDGFPLGMAVKTFGLTYPTLPEKHFPVQIVAVLGFFLLYRFLWYAEARYRTFEWYRAGRSSAKSGFLFSVFLIFLGLTHAVIGVLSYQPVIWVGLPREIWFGLAAVVSGIVVLYHRSGRKLKTDLNHLLHRR